MHVPVGPSTKVLPEGGDVLSDAAARLGRCGGATALARLRRPRPVARHARDGLGLDFLDWLSAVDQPDGVSLWLHNEAPR